MQNDVVNARLYPAGMLTSLSRMEVERLHDASRGDLYELLRRCALAVLNSGNESDDAEALLAQYQDFDIEVEQAVNGDGGQHVVEKVNTCADVVLACAIKVDGDGDFRLFGFA